MWGAVALVSLAAAAHQGWSANIFTTASDMFPQARRRVGGRDRRHGGRGGRHDLHQGRRGTFCSRPAATLPMFRWPRLAYLVALVVIHVLAPKLEPVTPRRSAS